MKKKLSNWVERYLAHLKLEPEPPSFSFLTRICRSHLQTFAFENISKMIYYRDYSSNLFYVPPVEVFVENAERFDFGGTCYTANTSLLQFLRELGFSGYHVKLGKSHIAILVELEELAGEKVYVDCGAAAPFFQPVRIEVDQENISSFGVDQVLIRAKEGKPGEYVYSRYVNGELTQDPWEFHIHKKISLQDLEPLIQEANQPGATFMKLLRCQLWQLEQKRNVSLVNNVFSIRYEDGRQDQHILSDADDLREVMATEFRLPRLPVQEAIQVLSDLGVDIFAKKE